MNWPLKIVIAQIFIVIAFSIAGIVMLANGWG